MSEQNKIATNVKSINETLINEKRILVAMRKTLSSVIRDVTPSSSSLKSPITQATSDDIVMCFGLITAREKQIEKQLKQTTQQKPRFIDEPKTSHSVSLDSLKASLKNQD